MGLMRPTMREGTEEPLTEINRRAGLTAGGLLAVFFPAVVAGLATVVLAMAAGLAGFHRDIMFLIAGGVGALLAIPAGLLLYRQRAERAAASRQLRNVEARVGGILESAMD